MSNKHKTRAVSFTKKHMELLLTAHDGFWMLKDLSQIINQGREDRGIIGQMGSLETLLTELSPLYDEKEDVSDKSEFWCTVLDLEGDLAQRAEKLLGL